MTKARQFSNTVRYIDDLLTLNNRDRGSEHRTYKKTTESYDMVILGY